MNDLTSNPIFWWVILALWLAVIAIGVIDGIRKKRFIYSMKSTWNIMTFTLNMLASLYFVIIAIIPMPSLKDWVNNNLLNKTSVTPFGRVVYYSIPVAYSVLVIIIICWIMLKGLFTKIKYNEQEKQWDRESENKFRKWMHLKPKKDKTEIFIDK